ncbi:glycerate kinase [Actinomadura sp. KC06]|uniref:glycerate kinase family protein n=1 Tax=Actinomadura sp. KC06 TaxID=2530369 RepID=UPI00104CAE56|nr:glycerate kinase [Actinomadura sp. KC06]TDD29945.1 glycerate kinase [Actinomadura sp. KC06]
MTLRVVLASDSFKSSLTAARAAAAMAEGFRRVRPDVVTELLPQADGGEGTLDTVLAARPDATVRTTTVPLPDGPHTARWLMLADDTAVVELAECCGLPLLGTADPAGADSAPLGTVLREALRADARRIVVGLGGSASTDGGAGCLRELGLRTTDPHGDDVPPGGAGLLAVTGADAANLSPPPPDGVLLLCDVDAPLFGPRGAATVFAPQKGADPALVRILDGALRRWADVVGAAPDVPGAGAAGGIGYGLSSYWGATMTSGARYLTELSGLPDRVPGAALVVTGEGRHDEQSYTGKVTGHVVQLAQQHGVPAAVIAGTVTTDRPGVTMLSLTDLAGSQHEAMNHPEHHLRHAAEQLAAELPAF